MKTARWKAYVFWIALCEFVGLFAGVLTREGARFYGIYVDKPPLSPPSWVFPVVWTALYALMGIGAARIALQPESEARSKGLNLMVAQLILNFFWPLLFFNAQAFGFAFVWLLLLWLIVLWMILEFGKTDPLAAWLQVPYLLWLTFAAYLNGAVWVINL